MPASLRAVPARAARRARLRPVALPVAPEADVRVSVIIPAFNEEATIVRCLDALVRQSVPPFEVLVVDNMSTDATVQRVRGMMGARFPIRLLSQTDEQGLVPTRNLGFERARGDVLARIDADTVVGPRWVEHLTRRFRSPVVAATSGPVGYYDLPALGLNRRVDGCSRLLLLALSRRHRFLFGSNMALRRSAWLAIRSEVCRDLEDRFHEDIDIAIHLVENRLRVDYAPALTATISARSVGRTSAEFHDYTRRLDRTYGAHGIVHPPVLVAGAILRLAYPVLHRARRRALRTPPPLA